MRCTTCGGVRRGETVAIYDPPKTRRCLCELLANACAAFDALSPEQQALHRYYQRLSFAYGNLRLDVPVSRGAFAKVIEGEGYLTSEQAEKWLSEREWDLP